MILRQQENLMKMDKITIYYVVSDSNARFLLNKELAEKYISNGYHNILEQIDTYVDSNVYKRAVIEEKEYIQILIEQAEDDLEDELSLDELAENPSLEFAKPKLEVNTSHKYIVLNHRWPPKKLNKF